MLYLLVGRSVDSTSWPLFYQLHLLSESAKEYVGCFSDIESILPRLAGIIGAEYDAGDFSNFEDEFIESGEDERYWGLIAPNGFVVKVLLERYEGYFFVTISGTGSTFEKAELYLEQCYLDAP